MLRITRLYVYTREGKQICEAVSQELLMIAPRVQQKALEEHIKMQKRQIKADMERLQEFTTPFEERVEKYNNAPAEVIGTEDLMVKGKGKKDDKVVALPQDKQFGDELRAKKQKQKQDAENEFFDKKAQDALSKLRLLG
jgi:putative transposase